MLRFFIKFKKGVDFWLKAQLLLAILPAVTQLLSFAVTKSLHSLAFGALNPEIILLTALNPNNALTAVTKS